MASIVVVLLLGFCAGMQLGKIAPIVGFLETAHGYSMTTIGWLTALIGLFVALAALPAARLVDRTGSVPSLKAGAIILSVGAIMLALVNTLPLHLTARTVEAVGYVFLVIAAPAYLATNADPRRRPMVLALWGSFVPVGYALANMQEEFVSSAFGTSIFLSSAAVPLGIFTAATLVLVRDDRSPTVNKTTSETDGAGAKTAADALRNAVLLAIGFGIYVLLQLGFFTFLPAFADSEAPFLSPAAIALFVPAGNMAAALLFIVLPARLVPAVAVAAFVFSAACSLFLFRIGDPIGFPVYASFAFLGGILVSSVFGSVPTTASARLSAAIVIGLIAQAGGLGTVGGPPLAGYLLDLFGWSALTWFLTLLSVIGTVTMLPLLLPSRSD